MDQQDRPRDRQVLQSITVGEAPTHIVTIPTPGDQFGVLTIPLSADNDLVKVEDGPQGLKIVGKSVTGAGKTHPHGHWLTCGDGDRAVVPNVFKGIGTAGSISIMDTATGRVLKEFTQDPNDPLLSVIHMPLAVGECHVNGVHKAYVANGASGFVTVIDVDNWQILANIPVTRGIPCATRVCAAERLDRGRQKEVLVGLAGQVARRHAAVTHTPHARLTHQRCVPSPQPSPRGRGRKTGFCRASS